MPIHVENQRLTGDDLIRITHVDGGFEINVLACAPFFIELKTLVTFQVQGQRDVMLGRHLCARPMKSCSNSRRPRQIQGVKIGFNIVGRKTAANGFSLSLRATMR